MSFQSSNTYFHFTVHLFPFPPVQQVLGLHSPVQPGQLSPFQQLNRVLSPVQQPCPARSCPALSCPAFYCMCPALSCSAGVLNLLSPVQQKSSTCSLLFSTQESSTCSLLSSSSIEWSVVQQPCPHLSRVSSSGQPVSKVQPSPV
jgi:hypothetical protein